MPDIFERLAAAEQQTPSSGGGSIFEQLAADEELKRQQAAPEEPSGIRPWIQRLFGGDKSGPGFPPEPEPGQQRPPERPEDFAPGTPWDIPPPPPSSLAGVEPRPAGPDFGLATPDASALAGEAARSTLGVAGPISQEPLTRNPVADQLMMRQAAAAKAAADAETKVDFDKLAQLSPDAFEVARAAGAQAKPDAWWKKYKDAIDRADQMTQRGIRHALGFMPDYRPTWQDLKEKAVEAVGQPLGPYQTPLVRPETAEAAVSALGTIGAMSPEDLQQTPVGAAIARTIGQNVSGVTDPNFALTLPAFESKLVRAGFGAQAYYGANESAAETIQKLAQGDYPGAAASATQAGINLSVAAPLLHSAIPNRKAPINLYQEPGARLPTESFFGRDLGAGTPPPLPPRGIGPEFGMAEIKGPSRGDIFERLASAETPPPPTGPAEVPTGPTEPPTAPAAAPTGPAEPLITAEPVEPKPAPRAEPGDRPFTILTEEDAHKAASGVGGMTFDGVQRLPPEYNFPDQLNFTITERKGDETTLSVPWGTTVAELKARKEAKLKEYDDARGTAPAITPALDNLGIGEPDKPTASSTQSTPVQSEPGAPDPGVVLQAHPSEIALRPEQMQYKAMDESATGTNARDTIDTPYDPVQAGNVLVWEPIDKAAHGLVDNQKYIAADGHHRHARAVKDNAPYENIQVLRESAGFSQADARRIAAERNIKDGKGSIFDNANFIREQAATLGEDEAMGAARRIGARSRKAATIALNAETDLYAAFIGERVTPDQAAAIAGTAPKNPGLQRVGLGEAMKGAKPADIANMLESFKGSRSKAPTVEEVDLFGNDDSAMNAMKAAGEKAGKLQREINEQIAAIRGAAKNPEKAKALGVDVKDVDAVNARLAELRALQDRARTSTPEDPRGWASDDEIRNMILNKDYEPAAMVEELLKPKAEPSPPPQEPPISEEGAPRPGYVEAEQFDLIPAEDTPFNLASETPIEREARLREEEHADEKSRQSREADNEGQGDLFGSPDPTESAVTEPGGLGKAPDPHDDPNFTVFPVDLPEAVRFAKDLLGVAIQIKKRLKALGGAAAGVFRHTEKGAKEPIGEIHLRADIADLLTDAEKMDLLKQAREYADVVGKTPKEKRDIARARYEYLLEQAYEEAKTKPPVTALKVLWHEIGHAVDWFSDKFIRARGNLFGHVAALHDYLKGAIALDPYTPMGKPMTAADRVKFRKQAEADIRAQIGPIKDIIEVINVEEPELRVLGITPQDVKNLFGMDARETMPQLYKWFAEQTAQVKKEIVKKAMQNVLDARLAALGKTEVVGMRTVQKTVHRKVGREPTPAEIEAQFKKLFRAELERRNLADLNIVKAELRDAIAWWRGTEKMESYFEPPAEMYAEAFSIFMNNPAALAKRAPTYYRMLHNYMDARPEVADIYNKIQNQLTAGTMEKNTESGILDSFDQDAKNTLEETYGEKSKVLTSQDFRDNVRYHVDRRYGPIYRIAKRAGELGERVKSAIGDYLYRESTHELVMNKLNREVSKPLVRANIDWKRLGLYMLYKRVISLPNIFHPYGMTSARSLQALERWKRDLGPKRFQALEDAHQALVKIKQEFVDEPMAKERMWSPELQKAIDENIDYATYDVIKRGEGSDGIERMLANRLGNLHAQIYRQVGNLGEIKNPATATVFKMLNLISATAKNAAKRETVAMLFNHDPGNIMEAKKRFVNDHWEYVPIENANVGTVVYMRDGKPEAFYVRKVVADGLNGGNSISNRLVLAAVKATGELKSTFTQRNYGFWPVNMVRDTAGWIVQMPGLTTPAWWARYYPQALKAAYDSIKGRPNPAADRFLERRMAISRADPQGVWSSGANEYDVKIASYGLDPAAWASEAAQISAWVRGFNKYREFGQVIERANKIAAMLYLDRPKFDKMPEWKKREIVRERGGSPDFLQKGASNPYIDFFGMFYNPWKEAIRSVGKAARENPFSFTAKTTAFVVAPSTLQVIAAAGGFGEDMRKKYRSIPDYDLSNYICVPLFWADPKTNKVAYLRLPLWEPARILHQMLWTAATKRSEGMLQLYGGTLPSMNAMLNVARMWGEWEIFGHNPYDSFKGKEILSDDEYKAKGWPARKELLKYSWNSMGGSLVYRFQNQNMDSPPTTNLERALQLPIISNFVGRWVKVSNRGRDDMARTVTAPTEQERALARIATQEVTRKLLDGEALTKSEKVMMRDPYAVQYLHDTLPEHVLKRAVPDMRLIRGKPKVEQPMVLEELMKNQ